MATRRAEQIGLQLRVLFALGSRSGLTDGQLLERVATRDGEASGLASEGLVDAKRARLVVSRGWPGRERTPPATAPFLGGLAY